MRDFIVITVIFALLGFMHGNFNRRINELEQQIVEIRQSDNVGQISDRLDNIENRWNEFEGLYESQWLPYIKILTNNK